MEFVGDGDSLEWWLGSKDHMARIRRLKEYMEVKVQGMNQAVAVLPWVRVA